MRKYRHDPLNFFQKFIWLIKLPFLASLFSNFSTICSHMLSKFANKDAQKSSIFSTKANFERNLFFQYLKGSEEKYQSFLCLNGDLPEASFFQYIDLPVIAADGAANNLSQKGVKLDLVIGDLDSATAEVQERYPCLKIVNQETSDLQKAFRYLKDNALLPTIVLGANGGYLDHILCNIALLAKESNSLIYDPPNTMGFFLNPGTYRYKFPLKSKISLMGAPSALLTSSGLKWEMENYLLEWGENHSCFNRIISPEVILDVKEGRLLLLLYLESIEDAGL